MSTRGASSSKALPDHELHASQMGRRNAGGRRPLYGLPYAVPTNGPPGSSPAYRRIQLGSVSSRFRGPRDPQSGQCQPGMVVSLGGAWLRRSLRGEYAERRGDSDSEARRSDCSPKRTADASARRHVVLRHICTIRVGKNGSLAVDRGHSNTCPDLRTFANALVSRLDGTAFAT
jgi:hypothetical protein